MKKNRSGIDIKSKGFGIVGWLLMIPVALIVLLILVIGFYEGRKAYWDYRVKQMCEKDGRVTVYERITISAEEYKRLGGTQGGIPLPSENKAKGDVPYFRQVIDTKIREWNPEVVRGETLVRRRSDGKLLGRSIQYWRRGGDFPTGLFHDSSFICPPQINLSKQIFMIEGATK